MSENGFYNFSGGSDKDPYLGPVTFGAGAVSCVASGVALVRSRTGRAHLGLVSALVAGPLGVLAVLAAVANRKMVVDPGPYDLVWVDEGRQEVGVGLVIAHWAGLTTILVAAGVILVELYGHLRRDVAKS